MEITERRRDVLSTTYGPAAILFEVVPDQSNVELRTIAMCDV